MNALSHQRFLGILVQNVYIPATWSHHTLFLGYVTAKTPLNRRLHIGRQRDKRTVKY
jgi:hypothetical protein